jgi:hypothetical protein
MKIEAEGQELILKNKTGDHVIIPKDKRKEVEEHIANKCWGCIDKIVSELPTIENYTEQ